MSKFRLKDFFPSEIGSPRAGQLDVFSKLDLVLADPDVKYYMIDAPVGVGKSAIVASIIKYFEHADINSVILTPLKYLQDQYSDVFPDIPNIKGRANYVCPVEHDRNGNAVTAAEASCSFGTQCHYSKQNPGQCGYYTVRNKALAHPYFVSNFRYFLLARKFLCSPMVTANMMVLPRKVLLIDEAHTIADEVLSTLGFRLTVKMLGKPVPTYASAVAYAPVISDAMKNIESRLLELEARINSAGIRSISDAGADEFVDGDLGEAAMTDPAIGSDGSSSGTGFIIPAGATLNPDIQIALKQYKDMSNQKGKLQKFLISLAANDEWIPQAKEDKYGKYVEFLPLKVSPFIPKMLFSGFDKVIMLSGTFMSQQAYAREVGIGSNDSLMYTSIPHPFPLTNRPIYYAPNIGNMSYKQQATSIPQMAKTIARLFDHYTGKRGIIFTVSGALQLALIRELSNIRPDLRSRITDATPENKEEALRQHMTQPDSVIFTTSMWQGVDLKDDLSRFQVFVKVPYASLGDLRIKKLANSDETWYHIQAAKVFCQGYGRSVRTETDYADTWILDSAFGGFYAKAQPIFPTWFQEALVTTTL